MKKDLVPPPGRMRRPGPGARGRWAALGLVLLLAAVPAAALDEATFRGLYTGGDYKGLAALCEQNRAEIEAHELADRFLYYCGQAKAKLTDESGRATDLAGAIEDLERSAYLYYLPSTVFALGKARVTALDQIARKEEKVATLWRGLGEMWDAIVKRHAEEGFGEKTVSDAVLGWSVEYAEALVDRMIKDQDDPALVRWLTARLRMLADRFDKIDPGQGENETRRTNLATVSSWMRSLYELSYFDGNPVVGVYKYMGDRREGEYDQTPATQDRFAKALYYYNEGLARARSLKAKAVFHNRIAYVCSLFQSDAKDQKVEYYKQGFNHAAQGLKAMARAQEQTPEAENPEFRFAPKSAELVAELQKSYGRNLSGFIYFLWERGDHRAVVALRTSAFDTGFDWKTKTDDLLRIADSAARLAKQNVRDLDLYQNYKEMCLTSASRAFKFTLKKYGGQRPTAYDENFCTAFSAYSAFLSGFGETVQATDLERNFGTLCAGAPAKAPAPAATEGSR